MANEATINSSLRIKTGILSYQSQPTSFRANVVASNGPTPGAITVPPTGIDVTLTQLTSMGGLCWVGNYSAQYSVQVGVKDTITGVFYPLMSLLPGEGYVFRLSRDLQKEEVGTGTFTGATCRLHLKTDGGGTAIVRVDAFDP